MNEIQMRTTATPVVLERAQPSAGTSTPPHAEATASKLVEKPVVEVAPQPEVLTNFAYDLNLRQIIITLKREGTGEILTQIPSEVAQRYTEKLRDESDANLDARG